MRVIAVKALREFWANYPDAETALRHWFKATEAATWKNFSDLRRTFSSADVYENLTIFNIGGNKYRLIAAIHYNTQRVYVRYILTHGQYDTGGWKSNQGMKRVKAER